MCFPSKLLFICQFRTFVNTIDYPFLYSGRMRIKRIRGTGSDPVVELIFYDSYQVNQDS